MAQPRITITISDGELRVYINPDGRDLLVKELQHLSENSDHFHLGAWEGAEVELRSCPYDSKETLIEAVKILFRPDDWDNQYCPHVMLGGASAKGP